MFNRIKTRTVNIGDVPLGGDNPIRVQSMTNTKTLDTISTVEQCIKLVNAGCEYVRITAQSKKEAENLRNIKKELYKKGYKVPIIADVHFSPEIAEIAAAIVEKVRINPGNYLPKSINQSNDNEIYKFLNSQISKLINICKEHGTALRIGSNHGSLSDRILNHYGDTPTGMVESALEFVRICRDYNFHNILLSMKASNVKIMVESTRLLVKKMIEEGMDYPIHLGVTEAGEGEDGIIRSSVGIGALLVDGIGDTIRVSLTGDPVKEIPVAYKILQSTGVRITNAEYISCPTCGRTSFNIEETLKEIKSKTRHLKGIKIAVMGCIVNGPGEMSDADYGYVGAGKGKINLYKRKEIIKKNIDEKNAVEELLNLINSDKKQRNIN
jgi:(E)-4-hydroxy-3-methylbut-2-enyl-diphosphate synthase